MTEVALMSGSPLIGQRLVLEALLGALANPGP